MYVNKADFTKEKFIRTILNDFPIIRPLDLETQLNQLLEALCMLIKLLSLKKNLAQRFSLIRPLDLETLLYQLVEALCMLIKPISVKKNVS